ncbi:hypothetical protein ACS5PU_07415 [Pedobacter sp. GSP4]|uniref:hypothetical protein n=1 Tax=Pedobacter sp. GSP4 TaxID=3453716 RepID=UPI003EEED3E0
MRKLIYFFAMAVLLVNCKKDDEEKEKSTLPEKTVLLFPAQNEACTSGAIVSATKSAIIFKWQKAANADSYELFVRDLLSNQTINKTTADLQLEMTLDRNTPYSWYVVSKSQTVNETAQSELRKFYNAGPGTVSYAPFPAEIISPLMAAVVEPANNKISLEWKGSDVDNDIIDYDLYFSLNSKPDLIKSNLKEAKFSDIEVKSKNTYYWKVITRDAEGNTSDSGVYQFTVK